MAMVLAVSVLVPTVMNLALLPGVTLGLLAVSRMKSRPALALVISNFSAYASIVVTSAAALPIAGMPVAIELTVVPVSPSAFSIGLLAIAFLSAALTAKAQMILLRTIESRVSYAALH